MDRTSELKGILGKYLDWNKARLDCFAKMLLALFATRTVNLREIAVAFGSAAGVDSRYKRIQRFFKLFKIDYGVVARWLFQLFFAHSKKVYVTIDRTNWYWGKTKINVLTLAIAYEGLAIPIFWNLLNKAGSATAAEHQAILMRFMEAFGKDCIQGVLADREFASGKFFGWLNQQRIPFYIRIKEGSQVFVGKKKYCKAKKLFNDLEPNTAKPFLMAVWIFGKKVYLAGSRSERGELMIVATNQAPKNAIAIYLRRWEIESLFQGLKSRGFRFEETHLIHSERIEKLMVLLAIGFCWAHKIGEWCHETIKPIRWNRHRQSQRPQYSFFRYGLDFIREIILSTDRRKTQFKRLLELLKLPISAHKEGVS
jgi:hypothetical protein